MSDLNDNVVNVDITPLRNQGLSTFHPIGIDYDIPANTETTYILYWSDDGKTYVLSEYIALLYGTVGNYGLIGPCRVRGGYASNHAGDDVVILCEEYAEHCSIMSPGVSFHPEFVYPQSLIVIIANHGDRALETGVFASCYRYPTIGA